MPFLSSRDGTDSGWDLRFGLFELDTTTGQRIPRPSAGLYGAIARENAFRAAMVGADA